ncbi:MAG TPA: flagellar hook capping FlgD N-terminal domain-containing protein [Clostridia bacterium]|nr:flagellar hook capping FlgD N-terminal domain-containing protein [Clostridia bacterium]
MPVNPIQSTRTEYTESNNRSRLGKDDFLKLLVAQMRNQDPLNPMDDRETISQMAQLSMLEQIQELNNAFMSTQAFGLLGKTISAVSYDESGEMVLVNGRVDKITLISGKPVLHVGDRQLALSDVREVADEQWITESIPE